MTSGTHTIDGATATGEGFIHVFGAAVLTRGATLSVLNNLQLSAGNHNGAGHVEVINSFLWQGGTISGSGMMTLEGSAEFSTTNSKHLSGMLIIEDEVVWTAGQSISLMAD